jgi:hypothetical protein
MPDDVIFTQEVSLGVTGKIDKRLLRERWTATNCLSSSDALVSNCPRRTI